MIKLNPCCTGDTLVLTVNGPVRFDELAKRDEDVLVYCYNEQGRIVLSKMLHPRISGYNQDIVRITLNNGMILNVTRNHQFLTPDGYTNADMMFEDDSIIVDRYGDDIKQSEIDDEAARFAICTVKKDIVVTRVCEVCGNEFNIAKDDRELCSDKEHEKELYDVVIKEVKKNIESATKKLSIARVEKIEFLKEKSTVYNGTVTKFHNYFTIDEETNTIVNQFNCGE